MKYRVTLEVRTPVELEVEVDLDRGLPTVNQLRSHAVAHLKDQHPKLAIDSADVHKAVEVDES